MAINEQAPAPPQADSETDDISMMLAGNRLRLITQGTALREALIDLIEGARNSLKLYYYIFSADGSGQLVRDALVAAGAPFERFGTRRSTRYLIRNHQKMAIADDRRLMIGGFNIEDGYFGIPADDCWCDLGLMIEGDQVEAMTRWYGQLWRWVSTRKQRFRTLRRMVRGGQELLHRKADDPFHWLIGGPTRRLSPWAKVVKHDMEQARRVDMVAAYFSPGRGMLKRIGRAAQRGGARIIVPARSDNGATVAASRLLYGPLLKRRVEIAEYQPHKLHMKLFVIDDAVFIGSANFDMRSLFLNLEVMLRIEDQDFATAVRGMIDRQAAQSRTITLEAHRASRTPLTLIKQWISYLLVGVLDYTVTRRLNFRDPDAD